MPKYTFKYFDVKALGEGVRLLLSYGNQEFEDIRVSSDDWATMKSSTPFGQMPILTIDDKVYTQSTAICRYLGKIFGVSGANPLEDLEIDMYLDFVHDIRAKAASYHYEKNEEVKKQKYEELKDVITELLSKLDTFVAKNNGHIALGKLTWADFYFAGMFDYLKVMTRIADFDKEFPNLLKVVHNVETIPQVKKYVDKRPIRDV